MDDNLVMVPVPTHLLTEVYGFIARQTQERRDRGAERIQPKGMTGMASPAPDEATQNAGWTPQEIERDFRESPEAMKVILKTMAGRAGDRLTTEDFADAVATQLGRSRRTSSIAGVLGAHGRRVKNRYRKSNNYFDVTWDDAESGNAYTMSPKIAKIIQAL